MNTKFRLIEKDQRLKGYKDLLKSALSFSLMSVCVKNLSSRIPVAEIVLARALISIIITRIMLYQKRINPWGTNKKLLIIRGCLGTSALFCIFKSISNLPLASATIIQYTYPTFISISAWLFLGEKLTKTIIIAISMGLAGITLIVQPKWIGGDLPQFKISSVLIALCGAALTALAYVAIRKLSQNENPLVIIYYFPLISIPATIPLLINNFIIPTGIEWMWLIGVGFFTQLGQIWITKGFKLIPAAEAASISYTQVLFATLWGIFIFSEPINSYVLIGSIFVLGAGLLSLKPKEEIS